MTIKTGIPYSLITTVFLVLALFVLPQLWGWPGWPVVIVALMIIGGTFLIRWHARHTGYLCHACAHKFAVSAWVDFLSPHKAGEKMLCCPRCGESSWCVEIDRGLVPEQESPQKALRKAATKSPTGKYLQIVLVLGVYAAMWLYTLNAWEGLPETAPTLAVLKIPLAAGVIPAMHLIFCLFAAVRGYKSRIYPAVTGFVIIFLLFAAWSQYYTLSHLG